MSRCSSSASQSKRVIFVSWPYQLLLPPRVCAYSSPVRHSSHPHLTVPDPCPSLGHSCQWLPLHGQSRESTAALAHLRDHQMECSEYQVGVDAMLTCGSLRPYATFSAQGLRWKARSACRWEQGMEVRLIPCTSGSLAGCTNTEQMQGLQGGEEGVRTHEHHGHALRDHEREVQVAHLALPQRVHTLVRALALRAAVPAARTVSTSPQDERSTEGVHLPEAREGRRAARLGPRTAMPAACQGRASSTWGLPTHVMPHAKPGAPTSLRPLADVGGAPNYTQWEGFMGSHLKLSLEPSRLPSPLASLCLTS